MMAVQVPLEALNYKYKVQIGIDRNGNCTSAGIEKPSEGKRCSAQR